MHPALPKAFGFNPHLFALSHVRNFLLGPWWLPRLRVPLRLRPCVQTPQHL